MNPTYVTHPWVAEGARQVRFGLYGGLTPDWPRSLEWVQLAEELGFDSFWLADHPVAHGRDCWTYLAALATGTRRIRLGSLVSCVYYRAPALLARIVADVDLISSGRIVLGLGIGDVEGEFAQLGLAYPPVRERQAALEEALKVLPRLLHGEEVTLRGAHFRVDSAVIRPGPCQEPRVPILVAAAAKKSRCVKWPNTPTLRTSAPATPSVARGHSMTSGASTSRCGGTARPWVGRTIRCCGPTSAEFSSSGKVCTPARSPLAPRLVSTSFFRATRRVQWRITVHSLTLVYATS